MMNEFFVEVPRGPHKTRPQWISAVSEFHHTLLPCSSLLGEECINENGLPHCIENAIADLRGAEEKGKGGQPWSFYIGKANWEGDGRS